MTYDTKGIVRLLDSTHYGGLSWIPILDATKQVGNKSDHYFLVGMTHNPDEIRSEPSCHIYMYILSNNYIPLSLSLPLPLSLPISSPSLPPSLSSLPLSLSPSLPPSLSPPLRAVLCKGLLFPLVHPRPVMTGLPLQLPLCEHNSEQTQLEVS